ncbi:MAG: lipopolysaccharide biosynthesis protein [Nitrospirae bacterium]|nr:lipopolysaccharide biosynthesis protein [Nitrospirota bacterium]
MSDSVKLGKQKSILELLSDTSVYGIGVVFSRFLGFIITPLLTRLFSVAEYGQVDVIQSGLSIAIAVASLYTESGVMKYYYEFGRAERRTLLSTHIMTMGIISLALVALFLPFSGLISIKLLGSARQWSTIRDSLWVIITSLLYQHVITVLRTARRPKLAVIYSLSVAGFQFLLVVLFVLKLKYGIGGIFIARALTEGLISMIMIIILRDYYSLSYSLPMLRTLLRFGLPMLPEVFTGIVIGYCSRYFLLLYHNAASLGLFSLAQKSALIIVVASAALKSAWLPYAFSISGQENAREIYSYVFSAYLKVMALLLAGLILFSRELILILSTKEYLSATLLIGLLGLTAVLQGLVYIVNIGILIAGKTRYYIFASLAASVITFALSALLIPRWGIVGAALVHLAAQLVMVEVVYKIAEHFYKIEYRFGYLVLFVIGFILLSLINLGTINIDFYFRLFLCGAAGIASYFFLLRKEIVVLKKLFLSRMGLAS